VDRLSDFTLANIFQGNEPVKTQVKEMERLRRRLQERIEDGKGTKEQRLAALLLPLASTLSQREVLLRCAATGKGMPLEDLEKKFNQGFEEVVSTRERTPEERKQLVAHLLFNLGGLAAAEPANLEALKDFDPLAETQAYKRLVNVVGVAAAAQEADEQAKILGKMVAEADSAIAYDRNAFLDPHARLVLVIRNLADDLAKANQFLFAKESEARKQEELRDGQKKQLGNLQKQLADAEKMTQDWLAQQSALEKTKTDRFNVLRNLEVKIQALEKEVREQESLNPKK
jgi:hypothetical protein